MLTRAARAKAREAITKGADDERAKSLAAESEGRPFLQEMVGFLFGGRGDSLEDGRDD